MANQSNLAAFLASNTGRRFFNIFYSWGASIVIIGALFKIIHLPYANEMLVFGMVTEALVFFISGFDDAQAGIDKSSSSYDDEEEDDDEDYRPAYAAGGRESNLIFSPEYAEKMTLAANSMDGFAKIMDSLNDVSLSILASYKNITDSSQGVSENSQGFAENIKALNQNVVGLNSVYEAQFQSVKDQMDTIKFMSESLDRIRELYTGSIADSDTFQVETKKMTKQIQALNEVYARMLQAMTANNSPMA